MGVLKGPSNGIGDEPILVGICMNEVEVGRWRGEEARREDQRPGDGGGGLKKFSSIGHVGSLGFGPLGRRCWG